MTRPTQILAGALLALTFLAVGACGSDEATGPQSGSLEVLLTMQGSDRDPNGGTLLLDGEVVGTVQVDVRRSVENLEAGIYVIMVTGISPNCLPLGLNERNVTIRAGQLASEEFSFLCEAIGGKDPGGGEID
ncbi:MAG: hypothetical protein KJO44_03790 [Gemmatimonadetes bacterium]|nr:hypothetical protein [Gemmatimonadota bacterium]